MHLKVDRGQCQRISMAIKTLRAPYAAHSQWRGGGLPRSYTAQASHYPVGLDPHPTSVASTEGALWCNLRDAKLERDGSSVALHRKSAFLGARHDFPSRHNRRGGIAGVKEDTMRKARRALLFAIVIPFTALPAVSAIADEDDSPNGILERCQQQRGPVADTQLPPIDTAPCSHETDKAKLRSLIQQL